MSTTINADFYKTKVWISKKKAGHNLKDPTKEETMDPQIYGYCTAILQRPIVDTSLLVYVDELSTTLCSLWEADSRHLFKKYPHFFWKLKIYYYIHKNARMHTRTNT
jgi:hypothetical protein